MYQREPYAGNERERLVISSGKVVAADQYMPANRQFIERLRTNPEGVSEFGACLFSLPVGEYSVLRDPREGFIALIPRDEESGIPDSEDLQARADDRAGKVLIDTRCVVLADVDLLLDEGLISTYRHHWQSEDYKGARDLVRERGAAVRYGFDSSRDKLDLFAGDGIAALWRTEAPQPVRRDDYEY